MLRARDTVEAETPADQLSVAHQERVAAEHRIGEAEFGDGLQDYVLDRAAGMVHQSLILAPWGRLPEIHRLRSNEQHAGCTG